LLQRRVRAEPEGLEARRAALELRFWILRQTLSTAEHGLKVIAIATLVAYELRSTVEGHPVGLEYLLRVLG
jgi:hypothetical protein